MKKFIISLIAAVLCLTPAAMGAIYSYDETESIMNGVQLRHIRRFEGDNWLNINAVTADLSEPHVKLELLKGTNSDSLTSMAGLTGSREGVLAAANADFFDNTKPAYSQGFSLGIEYKDGELLQSQVDENMAAAFSNGDSLWLGYMSMNMTITAPNGMTERIAHLNKHTTYYGDILLYTQGWNNGFSPAPGAGVVEVVVDNDTITEFRRQLEPVRIPENGYVLVVSENVNMFLANNFQVGDPITLDISVMPSLDGVDTAFGGGTILLKDGVKTKSTHTISGNQPRTCIGTNADGTVVYIITVDGRQTLSRGVTQTELADIALELGCVNAMNLDGGGSTRMLAQTFWNSELHIVNSPTENRKVINAVSITTDAEPGEAVGIKLRSDEEAVLIGDSIGIESRYYDENGLPTWSHTQEPHWSLGGVEGQVTDGRFIPSSAGAAEITAIYNDVPSDPLSLYVIGNVNTIGMPLEITLNPGETYGITPTVSEAGYTAAVKNTALLSPVISGSAATFENGVITAISTGYSVLTLSYGNVTMHTLIKVGEPAEAAPILPENTVNDPAMGVIEGGKTFRIVSFSQKKDTMFSNLLYRGALRRLGVSDSYGYIGTYYPESLPTGLRIPIQANNYNAYDKGFVLVISLPSSGRLSGSQWISMANTLASTSAENVIVLTKTQPNGQNDTETQMFYDYFDMISKVKNVYVIQSGRANSVNLRGNVRFITLADTADYEDVPSAMENAWILKLTMSGNECKYTFEKLYDQYEPLEEE